MTPLVSIIIPVYKVEKYIEKCMQSLLDQTYDNFEALVVDDGSPDSSITLAKELVGNDSRFIFFEKENGGQGSARNLGLDHAKGEYIAFLDSDDSYTPDMLQVVTEEFAKEDDMDVLTFGVNYVTTDDKVINRIFSDVSYFNTAKDVLLVNGAATRFFWDKVYKRDVLSKYRFSDSVKTFEDVDLIYQVLYKCSIKNIPNCLYNYTQREGSTMYSLPASFIEDKKALTINAKNFLLKNNIFKENKDYYEIFYLDEMFYKPLLRISRYSKNYKSDIRSLLSKTDSEMLTLYNISKFRSHKGNKGFLTLFSFRTNKYLPLIIVQLRILSRREK
ncbi:glycosyltransferase family 2 protein [Psychrobacter cibarius]|uniref:glycosyltransferase family 2 protein n=2 Tax=Psychrobacter cibarius TaxID=282669 RepID=UPI0018DF12F0|nr:glycosyltransferase family 2 protein [Psychrobacter cibarius]